MSSSPKFPIGTTFAPSGRKHPRKHTVTDIHSTLNSAGELVCVRYVATHELMGQVIVDSDVLETTIARGLLSVPSAD